MPATRPSATDVAADRAVQQFPHVFDQRRQVDGLDLELLTAGESQQALRQRRATPRALQRGLDEPQGLGIVGEVLAQQVEISHHRHQQVVEIMRDAAGQLADRLEFLRLPQLFLGTFALCHLGHHGDLHFPEFGRAFGDAFLEDFLLPKLPFLLQPTFRDIRGDADQTRRRAAAAPDDTSADLGPMRAAVRPDRAVFDQVVFAGLQRVQHTFPHAGAIVRMHAAQQIVIGQCVRRAASEDGFEAIGGGQVPCLRIEFPGAEPSGQQRRLQRQFVFPHLLHAGPRLILPPAVFLGGTGGTDEGGGMEGSFEEKHMPENLRQPRRGQVALRPLPLGGQDDERQVGPARLRQDPIVDRGQIVRAQGLVGHHGEQHIVAERIEEFGKTRSDACAHTMRLQQGDDRGVATLARIENQDIGMEIRNRTGSLILGAIRRRSQTMT